MAAEEFEWDDAKNEQNIQKHGIDFADAPRIFQRPLVVRRDDREDYGEDRWIALGELDGTVVVLAFTRRSGRTRIISIRKASRHERQVYTEEVAAAQSH